MHVAPLAVVAPASVLAAAKPKKRTTTRVQTLIFDKKVFSRKGAVQWAKTHDFRSSDVDETEESYRLRQRDPKKFRPGSFRTTELTKGVQAVVGKLK